MSRLAVVALLLLALAPAVSRVLAVGTPQVLAGWSELCTTAGLQLLPSQASGLPDAATAGHALSADGAYCDYCPLAASLSLLGLFLAFLLLAPPRGQSPTMTRPRLRVPANLRGLGGQGPPLAL
jgi:hypothetical protein